MLLRRFTLHIPRRVTRRTLQASRSQRRAISSASPSGQISTASSNSILAGITAELDRLGPRLDVRSDQVQILTGPTEFYETLRAKLLGAKKRIFLSTLYIGKSEHDLVSCLREALRKNGQLRVSILTDALRGTRESPSDSCASLLAHLVEEFPGQVEIRLYHTPNLTGIRKKIIPKRINEGWGLQHMKLYGIDEEVILSGANLSDDYFTNRQDRYHVFSSKSISDYFHKIHDAMCSVSFLLVPQKRGTDFTLMWPRGNASPSPLVDPAGYIRSSKKLFQPLVSPGGSSQMSPPSQDTALYPVLNIPGALNTELPALEALLTTPLNHGSAYLFTAGYFNPHPFVTVALLNCAKHGTSGTVLTASPWANGFYGSKGVSGMLPAAYTLLSRRFLQSAMKYAPELVQLREWRRGTVGLPEGWTYHAKGLWITLGTSGPAAGRAEGSSPGPSVTIIGSSNYTTRSYTLDTEVGAVIVTRNADLQARLRQEEENLLTHSKEVRQQDLEGGERRVGLGVRLAMWIVRAVGGSL